MLELMLLTKKIRHQLVLDQLSCQIPDGTIAGVLGPNHSGKSVLLKVLAGFMRKTSGEILLDEKGVSGRSLRSFAFIPSENSLPLHLTLKEMLYWYPILYPDLNTEQARSFCREFLPAPTQPLSSYSQGDLAKLNLILGCSRKVRLYLLDEPLQHIDENAKSLLVSLISACPDRKAIFVIGSHDPKEYEKMLDQALFLKQGKLIADKKPDLLRSSLHLSITEFYRKVMTGDENTAV